MTIIVFVFVIIISLSSKHLLGGECLAKEDGDPVDHPGKVGLHLLVGEEEQVIFLPRVPASSNKIQALKEKLASGSSRKGHATRKESSSLPHLQ